MFSTTTELAEFFIIVTISLVSVYFLYRQTQKLRQQKDIFLEAVNVSSDGLIVFDNQNNFKAANLAAIRLLPALNEYAETDKTFQDFLDYIFHHALDDDSDILKSINVSKNSEHHDESFHEIIEWISGQYCHVEIKTTPTNNKIVTMKDISQKKEQQENFLNLSRFTQEVVHALELAPCGIIVLDPHDPNLAINFLNQGICKIFNMDSVTKDHIDLHDLFAESLDDNIMIDIVNKIKNRESFSLETKLVSATNNLWIFCEGTPITDQRKRLFSYIIFLLDSTEKKQQEIHLHSSQKLESLGQLSAGIAHDFNNILSIIDGYARMASSDLDMSEETQEIIHKIQKSVERGSNLTKRMLAFGRRSLEQNEALALNEFIETHMVLMKPLLGASINLEIIANNDKIFVSANENSLTQILMNLVVNARDAMPSGGQIIIKSGFSHDSQSAYISVQDNGEGIQTKYLDKIFDPFFTTKEQGKGTGLGLSVVYGLVQQLKGDINVFSSPEKGTTFKITLPLSLHKTSLSSSNTLKRGEKINLKGYTALIAEDENELRDIVQHELEKAGMTVLSAPDGNEALLVQDEYEGSIDLLLTDIVMPNMNGLKLSELFEAVRPQCKTIFMSGYPEKNSQAEISLKPDSLLIVKPFEYEKLIQLIYAVLTGNEENQKLYSDNMTTWSADDDTQIDESMALLAKPSSDKTNYGEKENV